jgi:hypothetical protein
MANPNQANTANYDRNITPAEVASRAEREGENFKQTPDVQADANTTEGYTVDREGKLNNYAIEPEMYVDEPGDLREKEEAKKAQRAETIQEVNETEEDGKLSMSRDDRGKGTGII